MEKNYFIGVDVGTKSVRSALIDDSGKVASVASRNITVYNPKPDFYEQSSDEIWRAVCDCVQEVSKDVTKSLIKGIGFDATCSLVILKNDLLPLHLNTVDKNNCNVIMWMDHRAKKEAEFINSKPHKVLKYVGGKISLEMQMPKLLWLKRNSPTYWNSAEHFLGLPDFLTFKATGKLSRSLCSLVCKWTYMYDGVTQGWDEKFLSDIGLQELLQNNCSKIGKIVLSPGELVGKLTKAAANELGLAEETVVGGSIIDAHAGGLSLIFSEIDKEGDDGAICNRLGLISGTSTCLMCLSEKPLFVNGVWGPYLNAMVPDLWLNEGGQSATGSLVDHIVHGHPAVKFCPPKQDVYSWLETILMNLAEKEKLRDIALLTQNIHVYPDFHGNRSPLADSSLKGMISGLTLDNGTESLALVYLATLQALAFGTKDIMNRLEDSGHCLKTVLMCGGLSNSRVFIQVNADVVDRPVMIPHTKESVLVGAAVLGAAASGVLGPHGKLRPAASALSGKADVYHPKKELFDFYKKKFEVFKKMQNDQIIYREIMRY